MQENMTIEELAEYLDVHVATLRVWRAEGLPAHVRGGPKPAIYVWSEVKAWLEETGRTGYVLAAARGD